MKATFEKYVKENVVNGNEILTKINWKDWLYKPDMISEEYTKFANNTEIQNMVNMASCYQREEKRCYDIANYDSILDLKIIFVKLQLKFATEPSVRCQNMAEAIETELKILSKDFNPEVRGPWLATLVYCSNTYTDVYKNSRDFLRSYGRMKYIVPIYAAYAKTNKGNCPIESISGSVRAKFAIFITAKMQGNK